MLGWDEASSLGVPENFSNNFQQGGINIIRLHTSGGRRNRSADKIIVVGIGEITQLGIFLRHRNYATKIAKKRSGDKTTNFCEVGEMKMRGKCQIM